MLAALEELDALRGETEAAASEILDATALALRLLGGQPSHAVEGVREALHAISAACAFDDLVGQRLSRIKALLEGSPIDVDPLLNGPALPGTGLSQAVADALFSEPTGAD